MDACRVSSATGLPVLDEDHQILCGITRRLVLICSRPDRQCVHCSVKQHSDCATQVRSVISELLHFTAVHFAEEEALIKHYGIPMLAAHEADHSNISAHLTRFLGNGDPEVMFIHPDVLLQLVERWVLDHLPRFDEPLKKAIGEAEAT